jgi:hypothetical protein
MMKEENQMSIKMDKKIEIFKNYWPNLKKKLQKISKTLLFIFVLLFMNIGSKYPVNSEILDKSSISAKILNTELDIKAEYEKYVKLYQEIYESSFIQQIEFESEILIPESFDFKYVEYAYKTSKELDISPRVTFRLIYKESSFDDNALSSAGAKGLMQLMPSTRKKYYTELRIDTLNLDKIQEDIYIGIYYLKDLQNYWKERGNSEKNLLKLSLAAYNAGTSPVIRYKGVPPYKETTDFVTFILKSHSNPTFYANILKKDLLKEIS